MKADKFIKMMRTLINEEVRKVVREELKSIKSSTSTQTIPLNETADSLREKFRRQILGDQTDNVPAVPILDKKGAAQVINLNGTPTLNSILAETANSMRQDAHAGAFFEGLR